MPCFGAFWRICEDMFLNINNTRELVLWVFIDFIDYLESSYILKPEIGVSPEMAYSKR